VTLIVLEVKVKMKKLPTCLIARESSEENGGSKEYLAKCLLKCVKFEHNHISKIKALRKENIVLKFENEILQKSCEKLHIQINDLEEEKTILQNIFDNSHKSLLKPTKVQENLDKLLG